MLSGNWNEKGKLLVKIHKSPLPCGVEIKSELDYRKDPVFSLIKDDCHNKCYICEEKSNTSLQVNHRVSQSFDSSRKYEWSNLLLSCGHCNRVKGNHYNGILDCTQVDPEDYISLSLETGLYGKVVIGKIKEDEGVDETICLLKKVYNGESTAILKAECGNLRRHILDEIQMFQQLLDEFAEESDKGLKYAFQKKLPEA
jgi:hypothetical protein